MCEITKENFKEKLPQIKRSLQKSKFIAVDLEFSALQPIKQQAPRLFDNNKERYTKLRMNLLQVIPLQIGITAFQFDSDSNDYFGEVFTFYVAPVAFLHINKLCYFEASTISFLTLHKFDFNKFAYLGVPYLNCDEEADLRQKLKTEHVIGGNCNLPYDIDDAIKIYVPVIAKWYNNCKINDLLEIPDICKNYKHFPEIMYFLHKELRGRFKHLWTYEDAGKFFVKKLCEAEYKESLLKNSLDEDFLNDLMGFKHVFSLLTSIQKPVIGHNLLQDLIIMINNFETVLPESYSDFKKLTNRLFPSIFDTKTIYYELRINIPREKLPKDTSLEALFDYFKDGAGRHLVRDSSAIECDLEQKYCGSYHHAGWDSFCAGYIFIRMAYYNVSRYYPKSKKFVSSEVIGGLSQYKNCVNVIRGAASHIRLDGEDSTSGHRPPWLIVESLKNEPVDVSDLMSILSTYGYADVKKISSRGHRVLVAVDTYRAAREITKMFRANPKFQVQQYNFLRHSSAARVFILSAVTISGSLLLWLTHKLMRK